MEKPIRDQNATRVGERQARPARGTLAWNQGQGRGRAPGLLVCSEEPVGHRVAAELEDHAAIERVTEAVHRT